ncbi:MAG: sigma factor [Steroidobacteraceae bacterium]
MFHYARSLVRDPETAEEVVVDTMLAVWKDAGRFAKSSRLSTWILGIARHKALDAVRRRGRSGRLGQAVGLEDVPKFLMRSRHPMPAPTPAASAPRCSGRSHGSAQSTARSST